MLVDAVSELRSEPLFIRLNQVLSRAVIHLKIEAFNVAGSIKLKTARQIVSDLERQGTLRPGARVIESSSGNLGVALAVLCAERGYAFTCVSDPNMAPSIGQLIRAFGGEVIVVRERDPAGGYLKSRIDLIRRMLGSDPRLVWTNQYANLSNVTAHYLTTGAEILQQFPQPDWVFIGAGTTGTLAGCARRIREFSPRTRIIAVDSIGSVTFGGAAGPRHLPGIGTSLRPKLADMCVMDEVMAVAEEDAVRMCRTLARTQGILLGPSSGSVLSACHRFDADIGPQDTVVAISPDLGDHYLDTVYDDAWIRQRFPVIVSPDVDQAEAASMA